MSTELAVRQQSSLSLVDSSRFEHIQRVAKCYAESQLVPTTFQKNVPNIVVALEMASRIGASPLMVMQNMNVIHGRPSWSSQFMVSAINSSGRFTPLRYALKELGPKEVEYSWWEGEKPHRTKKTGKLTINDKSCVAWANEIMPDGKLGERLESPPVTLEMAVKEGWYTKADSKWRTMPDLMLRYRCATFFGRLYAPEVLMGIRPADEEADIIQVEAETVPEKPVDVQPAPSKPKKGIAAAVAAAAEPAPPIQVEASPVPAPAAPDTTEPCRSGSQAPGAPTEATTKPEEASVAPPPQEEMPLDVPVPVKPRCEIVSVEEKTAKKANGVGPICKVTLSGEAKGLFYFDGPASLLPASGAIVEIEYEEKGDKRILKRFSVVS